MPPLLIDMSQMIDLALGTPEVGVVNYNVLHALLHIMVNHLDLSSCRVEFRGNQSGKIEYLIKSLSRSPLVEFSEYEILDQEGNKGFEKRTLKKTELSTTVDRIIVVKKVDDIDSGERALDISRSKKPPPGLPLSPISVVSQDDFRKLTDKVNSIHDVISNTLPANQDVLRGIRGDDNQTGNPLNEMWNLLNMTKRIDAIEIGMEKLTTIINDLASEYRKWEKTSSKYQQYGGDILNVKDKLDEIQKALFDQNIITSIHLPTSRDERKKDVTTDKNDNNTFVDNKSTANEMTKEAYQGLLMQSNSISDTINEELESLKIEFNKIRICIDQITEHLQQAKIIPADIVQHMHKDLQGEINLSSTHRKQSGTTENDESREKKKRDGTSTDRSSNKQTDRKVQILESKVNGLEKQIFDVQKCFSDINDKVQDIKLNIPEDNDQAGIAELYSQLDGIKVDVNVVLQRTGGLIMENDITSQLIKAINEKTEKLNNFKVDREEIEELLAEKADYNMLQRKVSIDYFEATKKDLSRSLMEALSKLTDQETGWQSSIKEIQSIIDTKLNKEEISPLSEYINGKLQTMQGRIKALATLRRDPEAAGTKTRFLRNIDCLSCDQNVIMKMEEDQTGIPKQDKVPPIQSMRPFLTYELDNVRKEINNLANSRNMHHFELLNKEKSSDDEKQPKKDKHLCSRYCGGSHTTISAQVRVLKNKTGKSKTMNSDEPEYLLKGNDGSLYKGSIPPCICKPTNNELNQSPK